VFALEQGEEGGFGLRDGGGGVMSPLKSARVREGRVCVGDEWVGDSATKSQPGEGGRREEELGGWKKKGLVRQTRGLVVSPVQNRRRGMLA